MITPLKNKKKQFEVISNSNKNYFIKLLNKGNSILISCYYQKEISKVEYESEFDINYLKKVRLFAIYDSIDECLDEIFTAIDTNKTIINENLNNILLTIPLVNTKYKEIKFELKEKEKNDKQKFEELFTIINQQQKEIASLKSENINLKEKINKIENDIKDLLQFKNEIMEERKISIDSNIINNNISYKKSLRKWINPNQSIKSELLYRLTKDGDSISTFHNKCDNISPTLVLAESLNGYKFGGYTTCTWDNKGQEKNDGKTFLFSLNKNQKFEKKNNNHNNRDIYSGFSNFGPCFGYNDLFFQYSMKKCYSYQSNQYSFLNNKDLANNKEDSFEVKEVEVYKLIFN